MTKHAVLPILPDAQCVAHAGYKSAYFTLGPATGKPLVLCHGLSANGVQFVEDAIHFAGQGYRVIVPDLRGHGRSTCPENRHDDEFPIEVLAGDILAILDAEGVKSTHWVGNSLGGIIALSLMATNPERLERVATFGTTYSLKAFPHSITVMRWGFKILGMRLAAHLASRLSTSHKMARKTIFNMMCDADPDVCVRIAKHLVEYDFTQNAVRFDKPIVIIRGDADTEINAALDFTLNAMRRVENFQVINLENAGHFANLDQPDHIRRVIINFLEPEK